MATVEETMMKVQRILTGPMGLSVSVSADHFVVKFTDASTVVRLQVREWQTTGARRRSHPRAIPEIMDTPLCLFTCFDEFQT